MANIFKKIFNDKVFIVAEISANHGGSLPKALRLIREAAKAGADAVKFQLYTADSMTIPCAKKPFMVHHPQWGGQTLYELYQKAHTPLVWFKTLKRVAKEEGVVFFATAFDHVGVDALEELGVPFHKVASFELVDIPLIRHMASTGKPLILSTGMASVNEIQEAIRAARQSGAADVLLLKCVSSYPARPEQMDLRTIGDMQRRFRCLVGLSDHSMGAEASACAVSMGACLIEKHFTLSRSARTPDSFFSMEPKEFSSMVKMIRVIQVALGSAHYGPKREERESLAFRRSLFVVKDIPAGGVFSEDNVRSIRPSHGLPSKYLKIVLGRKASRAIQAGTPLRPDMCRPSFYVKTTLPGAGR